MNIIPSPQPQDIGPDQARELIRHTAVQYTRTRLDPLRVTRYAAQMARGAWTPTTDTLPLTPDGRLIDGLNRLMAVIISGHTLRIAVVRVPEPQPLSDLHRGPRWCDVKEGGPWPSPAYLGRAYPPVQGGMRAE